MSNFRAIGTLDYAWFEFKLLTLPLFVIKHPAKARDLFCCASGQVNYDSNYSTLNFNFFISRFYLMVDTQL